MPTLVSITETFVPFTTFDPESLVQTLVERLVLNWRVNPLKGAGQETCTRLLLIRFVMERNGEGQTVVIVTLRLLGRLESGRSLPTEVVFVMFPVAVGATVKVAEADELLLIVPRFPVMGLAFVNSVPCEMVADFRVTNGARKLVKRTLLAETGPTLVTIIV